MKVESEETYYDTVERIVVEEGVRTKLLSRERAQLLGRECVKRLCDRFGGTQVYMAKFSHEFRLLVMDEGVSIGGLPSEQADAFAEQLEARLIHELGLIQMYFSKGTKKLANERNQWIWKEFNGTNHKGLAKKYGLSERMIYDILRKKRVSNEQEKNGKR